jgi:hypothetical protein
VKRRGPKTCAQRTGVQRTGTQRTGALRLAFCLSLVLAAGWWHPAVGRVLEVGAGKTYEAPSAAAVVAQDGDTVAISPGTYFDCASWHASRLTIAATGPDVVITDRACAGKAAFVIGGDHVVVRGLVFTRIRVPDGNGAGIRAEGGDLTVEDSRFINNQVGILAGGPGGSLRISGCDFDANGVSLDGRPTHGVIAGTLTLLRIEHSTFRRARGGDHIASAALTTELVGNRLVDEGGAMAGPLVSVQGGTLTLDGNTVELDAGSVDRPGAVLVAGDAGSIQVRGNTLVEPQGNVALVRNWTGLDVSEAGNTVPSNTLAVSDSGVTYHRLRARLAMWRGQARAILASMRHRVAELARELHLVS